MGRTLHAGKDAATTRWVEPRRHQLRHAGPQRLLRQLARLKAPTKEAEPLLQREQNYFATNAGRMNYPELAQRGWPIGSGAVESAYRQRQCRFKRPGQFWTSDGLRHLGSLIEGRHNHQWEELWLTA
ncbi:MAG: hypothetical protein KIT22_14445 [Verrucomicrobiae bacterium]|nr:hypothetical protein [Verrucomicrobiae bacterium]